MKKILLEIDSVTLSHLLKDREFAMYLDHFNMSEKSQYIMANLKEWESEEFCKAIEETDKGYIFPKFKSPDVEECWYCDAVYSIEVDNLNLTTPVEDITECIYK